MDVKNIDQVTAFTTKDGSEIRELLAHRNSCIRNQSLAEARLPAGTATTPHYHPLTEEIYYILAGTGRMQIGAETATSVPAMPSLFRPARRTKSPTPARSRCDFCAAAHPPTSTTTRFCPTRLAPNPFDSRV